VSATLEGVSAIDPRGLVVLASVVIVTVAWVTLGRSMFLLERARRERCVVCGRFLEPGRTCDCSRPRY
jgi:hypothetical protein